MKKHFYISILSIVFGIFCVVSDGMSELKIDSVSQTLGVVGKDLDVTLKGSGFDANTRVSISLDVGNRNKILSNLSTSIYIQDIIILGSKAYIVGINGDNSSLKVIDISNPSNPKIVGIVNGMNSPRAVAISDSIGYVADMAGGLCIIDVSSPSNPKIIGNVWLEGFAKNVSVSGSTAYITVANFDKPDILQIVDISNYFNPKIIGYVKTPGWSGALVSDSKAYIMYDYGILQVIDISNPSNYIVLDTVNTNKDIVLSGSIAYDARSDSGLQLIDVSDPSNPMIISTVKPGGGRVAVSDSKACVVNSYGLHIIDVSNPLNPSFIGTVKTGNFNSVIEISGSIAYVTNENNDLQLVDVSDPSILKSIGSVEIPGAANDIEVSGSIAYIAAENAGLQVINVGIPSNPKIISTVKTPSFAESVAVSGSTVYVGDNYSGLQVIDVGIPSNPKIIGTVKIPSESVTVSGSTVYVGNNNGGLYVIDASIPSNPKIIGAVGNTLYPINSIAVSNAKAYVAAEYAGLQMIDLSIPSNPKIIGTIDTPGASRGVTILNSVAYVADGYSGLQIIDVNDSSNPKIMGYVDTPYFAQNVAIRGSIAYVADRDSGLQMIDVSNPLHPLIIGTLGIYAQDVAVSGNNAFIASGTDGLVIAPLPVEIEPLSVNNSLSITLPSPQIPGKYTLRVFNNTGDFYELPGAVTFVSPDNATILNSKAIIVAGGDPNDKTWEDISGYADLVYNSLRYQGYTPDDIYYLSAEEIKHSPDVDYIATNTTISNAIRQWTLQGTPASEVLIYFVGHGSDGQFEINTPYNQKLAVETLDQCLDELQNKIAGPVTFIYEACQSGTFIPKLTPPSGKKRIVITSASAQPAIFSGDISFSTYFWNTIYGKAEGRAQLYDAFGAASQQMKIYQQIPLVDANGNGIPNEAEDYDLLKGIIIRRGYSFQAKIPTIGSVAEAKILNGTASSELTAADVYDPVYAIRKVWAVVLPPDFSPGYSDTPISDLLSVELIKDNTGVYRINYNQFATKGTYTIYYYAMNSEGVSSLPAVSTVTQLNGIEKIQADAYEPDNNFSEAKVIPIRSDVPQRHTFHKYADEDWVKFYGNKNTSYKIQAADPGIVADPVIDLYLNPQDSPLATQNKNGKGITETLYWTCPASGVYYVKVRNAEPGIFSQTAVYDLTVSLAQGTSQFVIQLYLRDQTSGLPIDKARIISSELDLNISPSDADYPYLGSGIYQITAGGNAGDRFGLTVQPEGAFIPFTGSYIIEQARMVKEISISPVPADLSGIIKLLRILTGISQEGGGDINGDGKAGSEEIIYILQNVTGIR